MGINPKDDTKVSPIHFKNKPIVNFIFLLFA